MPVPSPTQETRNPVAVSAAFGRLFYGVGSTVYFSQVLTSPKVAGRCFQNNDPTSDDISDLLDTDGGVVPLDTAVNIRAIREFRTGVLCFADNGVWYIYNPDGGFRATQFNVSKITERGIDSVNSIVEVQGALFYFTNNGVMQVVANEFDNLIATDITETTIRKYFINTFVGKNSQGAYYQVEQEIWWWNPDTESEGMVFDLQSNGFYPQQNANTDTHIGAPLDINNDFVFVSWKDSGTSFQYSISGLTDRTFKDFGIDQTAYLVSGFETLGKFSHKKAVTEGKFYFRKTETQITGYEDNNYTFDFPSSCLFQARWDFDNSNAYSKWVGRTTNESGSGKKMELYQPMRRGFIPTTYPWDFNTGEAILSKRISIRGNGDAVQFRFEAQPEKDLQMLGYSVNFSMRGKM